MDCRKATAKSHENVNHQNTMKRMEKSFGERLQIQSNPLNEIQNVPVTALAQKKNKATDDQLLKQQVNELFLNQIEIPQPLRSRLAKVKGVTKNQFDGFSEVSFRDLEKLSPIEAIKVYCDKKQIAEPSYTLSTMGNVEKYICSVTVDNKIYSCYPNEHDTRHDAQLNAAQNALHEIKKSEVNKKYPVCMDSPDEIAIDIFDCIEQNGIFLQRIPSLYQLKYGKSLPLNFKIIIDNHPELFETIMDANGTSIVYQSQPKLTAFKLSPSTVDKIDIKNGLTQLMFPWCKKEWLVHITSVMATDKVWGYLIDSSQDLEKLTTNLNECGNDLLTERKTKTTAKNIKIGEYYFVHKPRCRRLYILDVDHIQKKALCLQVDYAEVEWIDFDNIYKLNSSMIHVPYRSIRFSLSNLEELFDHPGITDIAVKHLKKRTFIAEIKTNEMEYKWQSWVNFLDAKVEVTLYDTSTNSKVDMNELILKQSGQFFKLPRPKYDENV